ncbi:MAG: DUF1905 domain-containing protein [Bacteroidetes bacterium]|nr:DUF1905 domain-containing protein [Bacteroidota bacterium]
MKSHLFRSKLFTYPGKGGWTFAPVPKKHAPAAKLAWGRTPVIACLVRVESKVNRNPDKAMERIEWRTSVWTEKSGRVLLPLPKKIRKHYSDGDTVLLELTYLL